MNDKNENILHPLPVSTILGWCAEGKKQKHSYLVMVVSESNKVYPEYANSLDDVETIKLYIATLNHRVYGVHKLSYF